MKISSRTSSLLWLVALILTPGVVSAQPTPNWKPRTGDRLRFELTLATRVGYKFNGSAIMTRADSTIDLIWAVQDVAPNGDAQVLVTIDRFRTSSQSANSKFAFDSNEKPGETSSPLTPFYLGSIGESYSARVSPAGEVLDLKIPEKMTQAMTGTPFLGPENASSVLTIESALVSPEAIKALIDCLIPRKSAGGRPVELPFGPIRFAIDQRRTSPAGGARVESETTAVVKPAPGNSTKIAIEHQKGRGLQQFDSSNGLLTSSTFDQSAELKGEAGGQTYHQSIELTANLKCLGAEPVKSATPKIPLRRKP